MTFFSTGDLSLNRRACQSSESWLKFAVSLGLARTAQRSKAREVLQIAPPDMLRARK
jgi:hypothetical protein